MLENPSATDPMRIDYFSLMRKWYVALYRYGLRLTYDITIPEPGAAMRETFAQLQELQNQANNSFVFPVKHADITTALITLPDGSKEPNYLVLADKYGVDAPPPPSPSKLLIQVGPVYFSTTSAVKAVSFSVPSGYWIENIFATNYIGQGAGDPFVVVGGNGQYTGNQLGVDLCNGQTYLWHQSGNLSITLGYSSSSSEDPGEMFYTVSCAPTDTAMAQWQSTVWSALFNAAQSQFYTQQQTINAQITALNDKINNVDTLTLRREENDEIMKCALRWLLGKNFEFMPQNVINLFKKQSSADIDHGVDFTGPDTNLSSADWTVMKQNEDKINFINQAIDWDNVLLFSIFVFLGRAAELGFHPANSASGCNAAGVLACGQRSLSSLPFVRDGNWRGPILLNLVQTSLPAILPSHPYLTIAQQIQDCQLHKLSGISPRPIRTVVVPWMTTPPRSGRPVIPTLSPSTGNVSIEVADSTGFFAGNTAIIDTWDSGVQENQTIVEVPDGTHIVVEALSQAHSPTQNQNLPFPIVQAGEKGLLIAEWFEYTPSSGVDIAVNSSLPTIT